MTVVSKSFSRRLKWCLLGAEMFEKGRRGRRCKHENERGDKEGCLRKEERRSQHRKCLAHV
jgi:hypothetical protein